MLELGVAAAVVLTVALTAGSSPAATATGPPGTLERGWSGTALPVITALVEDLSAIDRAAKAGDAGQISATRSVFLGDVGRAHSLLSPRGSLGPMWSSALGEVDVVASAMSAGDSVTQDGQLRPEAEGAAEALVSFVGSMQHASK